MGLQQISYAFQQCKNFENRLRFDKVTQSLKVGTFLRHSVDAECVKYRKQRNTYTKYKYNPGPKANLNPDFIHRPFP